MSIRNAVLDDHTALRQLLDQLEYPGADRFLLQKMIRILNDPAASLLVYESEGRVLAFMSINFITQLALEGDFARISYFAVDDTARNKGIGRQMEAYGEQLARNRKCDRIEVHCHERRAEALRFYRGQGFIDSPKYLVKSLT
jgi:GNAT superfamily N-acetyltransferase